jgi:HlyD family secretion protein
MSISLKFKPFHSPNLNRWLVSLLVLLPMIGIGYVAYNQLVVVPQQQAKNKVQTASVERSTLSLTISTNGTVQPEMSVNVSPKSAGILKQLLVKEGDSVQQGQVLAYMDVSNLQGQLRQAQGNLAAAEVNLQRAIAGNRPQDIAQAAAQLANDKAALRSAESTFQQNQQLYSTGALAQRDLITSRAARDQAAAQVQKSQQALDLQKVGSRPEDIEQNRALVMAAQGAVQMIQTNLNDTVIRAPFSGIVVRKFADPGSFVTPTTAGSAVTSATSSSILALASTNQIVAQVAEANIAQIRLGLGATIQADAYPGKTFTGQVTEILNQADVVQNVTSFEVKTSVSDPQRLLRSGMNVTVEFKAGELKDVLVVPTAAIVQQTNAQGVFVAKGKGDPVFVPIAVGATVNDKTEVRSGLTGNEQVLLSFPPGTRQVSSGPSILPGMGGGSRTR